MLIQNITNSPKNKEMGKKPKIIIIQSLKQRQADQELTVAPGQIVDTSMHVPFDDEKIKKKVEFIEEDLTKGHTRLFNYDIIFCRYLLIYFNHINRDRFLKIIENRLNVGGLLVLGKTETLFNKHPVLSSSNTSREVISKTTLV